MNPAFTHWFYSQKQGGHGFWPPCNLASASRPHYQRPLGGPLIFFQRTVGVLCIWNNSDSKNRLVLGIWKASKSKNLRFFLGFLTFLVSLPARFQVWQFHQMETTYWWCLYLYIRFENQQWIDAGWKNRGTLLVWGWNGCPPHTYDINIAPWWAQNEY